MKKDLEKKISELKKKLKKLQSELDEGKKNNENILSRSLNDTTAFHTGNSDNDENFALFHHVVESIPHNIFCKDLDGHFIYANKRYCSTEGLPLEEIIGKTDYDIHPKEYADKYKKDDSRVIETEEVLQLIETHYPNIGKPEHVQVIKAPLYDANNKVNGIIGSFWDITEKREAETALRISEARLRDISRSIPGVIFQVSKKPDKELQFTFVSEQVSDFFRFPTRDMDLTDALRKNIPEKEWHEFINEVKQALTKKRKFDYTFPYITQSNEKLWIHSIASPSFRGNEIVFSGVFLDITRNRQMEERNRELEEQFNSALRMKSVGTLAGGIAHNINNVLMGIQGRISLINLKPDDLENCLKNVQILEQYVKNAADLTRDLLAFARGGKYEVLPTDINELIKNENRLFENTRREITVDENLSSSVRTVEVDRSQIKQAILNLYLNSSQAMPEGGTISVKTYEEALDIYQSHSLDVEQGEYVIIEVSDKGYGIDEETLKHVFEPFFSNRGLEQGTGLGLSSVYGIVKNHGGGISIKSEKGKGTTVKLYFPVSGKPHIIKETSQTSLASGDKHVLIVDDEKMILDVGSKMLISIGYEVEVVQNGEDAIKLVKENSYDLIIMDMIMPKLSGSECAKQIRSFNTNIPILFSSGYSEESDIHKSVSSIGNGFIQKPYTLQELSQKITHILEQKSETNGENV
jgi:two-component system cell cycle sensor histidine kinase/response regulator CckA